MNIEMGFGEHSINFTAEFPDFEPLKPEKTCLPGPILIFLLIFFSRHTQFSTFFHHFSLVIFISGRAWLVATIAWGDGGWDQLSLKENHISIIM